MSDEMALALANFLWASSETHCGSVVLLTTALWENTTTLRSAHGMLGLRPSTRATQDCLRAQELTSQCPGPCQPAERRTDLRTPRPGAYGKRQDTLMNKCAHTHTHTPLSEISSEGSPGGEALVLVLVVSSSAGGAQSRSLLLDDPQVLRHRVRQAAGTQGDTAA